MRNNFTIAPYLEEARERVTYQFTDKPVFDKYLQLLILGQVEIQEALKQMMQLRSIDTAQGTQLDNIGEIVGQPRELLDTDLLEYFAFAGYPLAASFGDLENSSVGGPLYNLGDPLAGNTLLNDEQYRLFIKAKILKNTTTATPEDLLRFVSFVFGVEVSNLVSEGDASYTILLGRQLTSFERTLLTYTFSDRDVGAKNYFVIKPVGVRANFGEYPANNFFGFQGVAGAKGFGDDPRVYAGGYGSAYGQAYGRSANDEISTYDGSITYDGSLTYVGEREIIPDLKVGGIFANLF